MKDKGVIQKERGKFQQFLQGETTRINELQKLHIGDNTQLVQVKNMQLQQKES